MRPQPFPCSFIPRSEEIKLTVEREGRQALENLSACDFESARIAQYLKKQQPA